MFLYQWPLWLMAVVITGASVAYGIAALYIGRALDWHATKEGNDAAGFRHAFVGVVYAVALALIVVNVQAGYDRVEESVLLEASAIGDLYRTLDGLPPAVRDAFQGRIVEYLEREIAVEFPTIAKGGTDEKTWVLIDALVRDITRWAPSNPQEAALYQELLVQAHKVLDARRVRIFTGTSGISGVTWLIIVLGACITIGFAALFYADRLKFQLVTMTLSSMMFGLMIFLIAAMNYPLIGEFAVGPDTLVQQRQVIERLKSENS